MLSYPHNYEEVFPSPFRSRRRSHLVPDLRPILKCVGNDGDRPDLELLLIPLYTAAPRREPHKRRRERVLAHRNMKVKGVTIERVRQAGWQDRGGR